MGSTKLVEETVEETLIDEVLKEGIKIYGYCEEFPRQCFGNSL